MRNSASGTFQDHVSIWSSYRRTATRIGPEGSSPFNRYGRTHASFPSPTRAAEVSVNSNVQPNNNIADNEPTVERFKAEIRKLRRLVKKKDLVIDMLVERIAKLRRLQRISEDDLASGDSQLNPASNDSDSTLNATTAGIAEDSLERSSVSSISSTSDVYSTHSRGCAGRALNFTAVLPSQANVTSHKLFLRKGGKHGNHRLNKCDSTAETTQMALLDANRDSFRKSSETFIVPMQNQQSGSDSEEETEVRHLIVANFNNKTTALRETQMPQGFPINRDMFVIESLSSRPENSHPDWKPPVPLSFCLRVNRPEVIRRIESRQAAITAASTLRHLVAEEKMVAARAVVQGKCSFKCVRNSLFMDPTLIKAFPNADMASVTKRRLRTTNSYKAEVSEERNRMDIAASKIIAHSFSESTRLAVLGGRASLRR